LKKKRFPTGKTKRKTLLPAKRKKEHYFTKMGSFHHPGRKKAILNSVRSKKKKISQQRREKGKTTGRNFPMREKKMSIPRNGHAEGEKGISALNRPPVERGLFKKRFTKKTLGPS